MKYSESTFDDLYDNLQDAGYRRRPKRCDFKVKETKYWVRKQVEFNSLTIADVVNYETNEPVRFKVFKHASMYDFREIEETEFQSKLGNAINRYFGDRCKTFFCKDWNTDSTRLNQLLSKFYLNPRDEDGKIVKLPSSLLLDGCGNILDELKNLHRSEPKNTINDLLSRGYVFVRKERDKYVFAGHGHILSVDDHYGNIT